MTGELGNSSAGAQRTRRNVVKMGAAVATLATTKRGVAAVVRTAATRTAIAY